MFEMVKALAKGATMHVVLSSADAAGFETLLTDRFDEIATIVSQIDARDAQISKVEDREYILPRIAALGAALARHQAGERAEVASAGIAPACDPEDSGDASPRPGTRRGRLGSGRHTSLASTTRCVPGSR